MGPVRLGCLAVLLAGGCGPKAPEPLDIALLGAQRNEAWVQTQHGAVAAAEEAGFTIEASVPEGPEPAAQSQAIEEYLQRGVKGIALVACDGEAVAERIRKATAQGVPCVTVETDAPGTGRIAFVTAGDESMGFAAGRALVKALTDRRGAARGALVIVMRSRSDPALQQRAEGFAEVVRDEPGVAVLDTLEYGDAEAARDAALRAIMQYQRLSAFYATEPAAALACAEAVEHMARLGEIKIACVGGTSDIMRRVDDGSIIAAVAPRHYMAGKQAVNLLWTIITKGEARALERLPEHRVSNVGADLVTARDLHSRRVEFRRLGLAVDF